MPQSKLHSCLNVYQIGSKIEKEEFVLADEITAKYDFEVFMQNQQRMTTYPNSTKVKGRISLKNNSRIQIITCINAYVWCVDVYLIYVRFIDFCLCYLLTCNPFVWFTSFLIQLFCCRVLSWRIRTLRSSQRLFFWYVHPKVVIRFLNYLCRNLVVVVVNSGYLRTFLPSTWWFWGILSFPRSLWSPWGSKSYQIKWNEILSKLIKWNQNCLRR